MKTILVLTLMLALNGCAGFAAYVNNHAIGIGAVGLVAGTVSQVENAVIGADTLIERSLHR